MMEAAGPFRTRLLHSISARFDWHAVLAFLVAVPATGVWVRSSGHDFARAAGVGLCLIGALAIALRGLPVTATFPTRRTTVAMLLLATVSTLLAPELRMAAREGALNLGIVAVALVVARRIGTTDGIATLLATVAIAGASYAALTFVGLAANLAVADTLRPFDLLIGYDNGRFFNHVQTSMLPLLALATLHPFENRLFNRLAGFGLAMGLALLVLSEGRATGLALAIGAASGTALFPRTAWPIVRSVVVAGAFAALVYGLCFVLLPRLLAMPVGVLHVGGVTDADSAHARFILWRIALDGIQRSPWFGIGPMHFSHTWNSDAAHPHNVYLQVAEEWGVPMLLLLLGIAFVGLRTLYRAVRDHRGDDADRRVGLVLFATLVAIGVDGTLSGNFVMPVSQVWIAVVVGAAIGWVRRNVPPVPEVPASRLETFGRRALRLLPLAAMLWLAASVAPELGVHLLDRPGAAGTPNEAGAPRFWANGWF